MDLGICSLILCCNRRDGVVVGASALQSADLGFTPLVQSYQKTLNIVSIAFLLGTQHLWEVVENKPANSLVVSLGKALNGTSHLRHLGNSNAKRVRNYRPKHSDTIRFLVNGG